MKAILNIVLPIAWLGFFALSIWYVGYRLHSLFDFLPYWKIQTSVAVAVVGSMAIIAASVKSTNKLVSALNVVSGYIFTFIIYLFILLICLHIIQLILNPSLVWGGVTVLVLALMLTVAGALGGKSFVVKESEIQITGLEKEISVMQISDVHLGHHHGRAYLAKIVEETNRLRPDLVLITGDLVDSEAALLPGVLDPLSDFTAPTYFVGGNHEKYVDTERALELIAQHGVRVLHNEVVETQGLQLVGLDYMNADENTFDMHPSDDTRTIKLVLPSLPLKSGMPSVLMHHSPVGAQYVAVAGIDLMVSGHTHAGQVFPFTLFNELIFPFNRGLQQQGKTKVFVSQGAGTYMLRARLGTSNEINLLRLMPSN